MTKERTSGAGNSVSIWLSTRPGCAHDSQVIEIVYRCGDTCGYCTNNEDGKCRLYDFNPGDNGIDIRVLHRLSYKVGEEITFGEVKKRVREKWQGAAGMCFTECGLSGILECGKL